MNFGGFATPERQLVFDINDLETLPAPREWDAKRLVASFVLAARSIELSDVVGRNAATACAQSYRKHISDYPTMDVVDIWYARILVRDVLAMMPNSRKVEFTKRVAKATAHGGSELVFPKLADLMRDTLANYRDTLPEDRRVLYDRLHLVDIALKVVGIGSVGTVCIIALFLTVAGGPFFLQVKEANASVLEPYAGASAYSHHGQRVVMGQRLMQSASDMFLGWVTSAKGRQFYIRQLHDVKLGALVETFDSELLTLYGELCGWALARAHASAGDPWTISGYLGKNDAFDVAMGKFALAYADQAEQDHAGLKAAVRSGTVEVNLER